MTLKRLSTENQLLNPPLGWLELWLLLLPQDRLPFKDQMTMKTMQTLTMTTMNGTTKLKMMCLKVFKMTSATVWCRYVFRMTSYITESMEIIFIQDEVPQSMATYGKVFDIKPLKV